ncbi:MAG: peptidoglycan editing factor PgeF [Propionibacteriaceae bacterium]|jgi:YfiH family protein|nr:peptidoglycan editing factor PgeF [Propionibacteriaceae bacterium]
MFSTVSLPSTVGSRVGFAFTDRLDGFSTGTYSSLNLGRAGHDDGPTIVANLAAVLQAIEVDKAVATCQVHSADVAFVDEEFVAGWTLNSVLSDTVSDQAHLQHVDALVTKLPGVALMMRVADCVPVLLADEQAGVIAAAHAGRVGLLAGVLTNTVACMREHGANKIRAWVGPHICGSCYEVSPEMRAEVALTHPEMAATTSWGTPSLDLTQGVTTELCNLGVTTIDDVALCTLTNPDLFSYREDPETGRQAGLIWMATASTMR